MMRMMAMSDDTCGTGSGAATGISYSSSSTLRVDASALSGMPSPGGSFGRTLPTSNL
jgi:hypothetical protein